MSETMIRPMFQSLTLLLVFLTGGAAYAQSDLSRKTDHPFPQANRYRVIHATGRCLAFDPWDPQWKPIEAEAQLPAETLIQIGEHSSLTIQIEPGAFGDFTSKTAQVKFNTPTVLRLDDHLLRSIEISPHFISVPEKFQESQENKPFSFFPSLEAAWKRTIAILARYRLTASVLSHSAMPEGYKDTEIALSANRIKLFSPVDNALLLAEHFPAEIKVSWSKVPDLAESHYEVMAWKALHRRGSALASTPLNYYTIRLFDEGDYFIQVVTKDGKWQSTAHRITIVRPLRLSLGSKKVSSPTKTPSPRPISLLSPPANFTYFAEHSPVEITFRWAATHSSSTKSIFDLIVEDRAGHEVARKESATSPTFFSITSPGDYRWYLREHVERAAVPPARSELRELHLAMLLPAPGAKAPLPDQFEEILTKRVSGVFYFEAAP